MGFENIKEVKIIETLKARKHFFLIILVLLLGKSFIQLFEFPNSIKLYLIRIFLFLLAIFITIYYLKNWKLKLLTIISIILISILQGELNIWKIPARKEVKMIEQNYSEL